MEKLWAVGCGNGVPDNCRILLYIHGNTTKFILAELFSSIHRRVTGECDHTCGCRGGGLFCSWHLYLIRSILSINLHRMRSLKTFSIRNALESGIGPCH